MQPLQRRSAANAATAYRRPPPMAAPAAISTAVCGSSGGHCGPRPQRRTPTGGDSEGVAEQEAKKLQRRVVVSGDIVNESRQALNAKSK